MLNTEFKGIAGDDTDYYPGRLRAEIDRMNEFTYANVNNGVYRPASPPRRRATRRPMTGCSRRSTPRKTARRGSATRRPPITEADWRLLTTLMRFDVAYFSLFKCNRQRIADYPNLTNYMRELYAFPGVADDRDARAITSSTTIRSPKVNPTMIIPKGTPVDFGQPHDRARLAA